MNFKDLLFDTKFRDKGNNNAIYLIDKNNIKHKRHFIIGCKIKIFGNNNTIIIGLNSRFKKSEIFINAENSKIIIGNDCAFNSIKMYLGGTENEIIVGDNFSCVENCKFFAGGGNQNIYIGNDCLFSRNVNIYAHDGHPILNVNTNEVINVCDNPVKIGNHVWIGHGVYITKGVSIMSNSIVGLGSIVTNSFDETNVIIAGSPAKIIKKNISFKK